MLVMASRGIKLILGMRGEAPQLSAVTKDDLRKASLQRALQDVVSRRTHVDVAIVAAWPLWVNCPHATGRFGKLGK